MLGITILEQKKNKKKKLQKQPKHAPFKNRTHMKTGRKDSFMFDFAKYNPKYSIKIQW